MNSPLITNAEMNLKSTTTNRFNFRIINSSMGSWGVQLTWLDCNLYILFPFCCLKVGWFKVQNCLSRRTRLILRPRAWQNCRNEDLSANVVEILTSTAEFVLTLELNFERDKTGGEGKFHNTYIFQISKFMIARY